MSFSLLSSITASIPFGTFTPLGTPSNQVTGNFGNFDFAGIANLSSSNQSALSGKTIYYEIEAHFAGTSGLNGYTWGYSTTPLSATLSGLTLPAACANTTPNCHVYYGLKALISSSPLNLYWSGSGSTFTFYVPFDTPQGQTPPNTDSDEDDVFMLVTN